MKFHIGDILSITTGKLISPTKMDGIYKILEFMTGGPVWTHQIPRVSADCKFELLKQFPQFDEVDQHVINQDTWESVLKACVEKYGEFHEVKAVEGYQQREPLSELAEMMEGRECAKNYGARPTSSSGTT